MVTAAGGMIPHVGGMSGIGLPYIRFMTSIQRGDLVLLQYICILILVVLFHPQYCFYSSHSLCLITMSTPNENIVLEGESVLKHPK